MNIFRKLFSIFRRPAKRAVQPTIPSLTILMAINPEIDNREESEKHLADQAEKLAFLNPKTVFVDTIKSYEDYNVFCKKNLADAFDTDFVLVIQMDSKVVNASAWDHDFFKYDYIGAPWQLSCPWLVKRLTRQQRDVNCRDFFVGNGGFSLRSKKFCEAVKQLSTEESKENEDSYVCNTIRDQLIDAGMRFAPYDVAKKFAVENFEYTGQFGAHRSVLKDGKKVMVKDL